MVKNYKLLNYQRNDEIKDTGNDDDDEEEIGDSMPLNRNNSNGRLNDSGIIEIQDSDEIDSIENNNNSNDNNSSGNSDNEEGSLTSNTNSNNSNNSFFQKIKNNISSSFRKYKERYSDQDEQELEQQQQQEEEEPNSSSRIDYSYYLNDNEGVQQQQQQQQLQQQSLESNNSHPNTITITTNNINSSGGETQITQVPLYSVNTTPTWFIRANDPYSLESHIINHMRSNSRYDVLLEQFQQQQQQDNNNIDNSNSNNNNDEYNSQFRPFSNNFLSQVQQISDQQNNLIKDNDIIVIEQPNSRLSIGFSENKFNQYHKNGEHNPSAYFTPNEEIIHRLSTQYRDFGLTSPPVGIRDDLSDTFSDYGIRLSVFELQKRKRLFLSILSVEIFYNCLLLTTFHDFHPLIIFLLVGLVNNIFALISVRRHNNICFSIFLCIEILMIAFNYFTDLTTLFILRVILFMIGYKLRQEMIIFSRNPNFQYLV